MYQNNILSRIFTNKYRAIHNQYRLISQENFYDVVIAGGGLIGLTMACAIANNPKLKNKKILLLEGAAEKKIHLKPNYSNRVVSLNPGTKSFLDSIGVWKHIADARFKAVKKMQIWEAYSDALITFTNNEMNDDISFIVENDLILSSLEKVIHDHTDCIKCVYKTSFKQMDIRENESTLTVETHDDKKYTCKLLIGADGFNSKARTAIGVHYLSWNYKQKAIVATLRLSELTDNVVAWQRFLPTGPIAILPLTDELSSLVWSTTVEEADRLLKVDEEQFVNEINDALWKQYPRDQLVQKVSENINKALETLSLTSNTARQLPPSICAIEPGSRAAFPLGFGHADNYISNRVVLIGDAAHRIHPLAGQGVNLGFGDIQTLTNLMADAVYSGYDIGSKSILSKYESSRQRHNVPTMLAVDGLQKLYNTSLTPVVILRSVGLQLTNAIGPLKKVIMNHASL